MSEYISYFATLTSTTPVDISWETMATTIRGDLLREKTEQYRTALANDDKDLQKSIKKSCPGIICQARMEGGRGKEHIRGYTGTFMVDFDHVPEDKLSEAINIVKGDKHTLMAYVTISGRGLRVIARVEGEVTHLNYKAAWLTVNEYYKKLTGLDYDLQCSSNTRVCGLAHDPNVSYNPIPIRLRVNKSLGTAHSARKGKGAGRPVSAKRIAGKVRQMVEADGAVYADGKHNDYISRCIYLMNRFGVNRDNCEEWALAEFEDYDQTHPKSIAEIVKSVYLSKADEHATLAKRYRPTVAETEEYIKEHYTIRLNLLSFQLEYSCNLNLLITGICLSQQFTLCKTFLIFFRHLFCNIEKKHYLCTAFIKLTIKHKYT